MSERERELGPLDAREGFPGFCNAIRPGYVSRDHPLVWILLQYSRTNNPRSYISSALSFPIPYTFIDTRARARTHIYTPIHCIDESADKYANRNDRLCRGLALQLPAIYTIPLYIRISKSIYPSNMCINLYGQFRFASSCKKIKSVHSWMSPRIQHKLQQHQQQQKHAK